MREFTCIVCGATGIDRSHTQNKQFCCKTCADAYWRVNHGIGNDNWERCQFNEGVVCSNHKCSKCGWNPEVAKKRMEVAHG